MSERDTKTSRIKGALKNSQGPINTEFANYVLDDISLLKDIMVEMGRSLKKPLLLEKFLVLLSLFVLTSEFRINQITNLIYQNKQNLIELVEYHIQNHYSAACSNILECLLKKIEEKGLKDSDKDSDSSSLDEDKEEFAEYGASNYESNISGIQMNV